MCSMQCVSKNPLIAIFQLNEVFAKFGNGLTLILSFSTKGSYYGGSRGRSAYRCNTIQLNLKTEIRIINSMVAYFCREIRDSYRDNFRKLSRKFEVSRKVYLDSKRFSKKYITIKLVI